MRDLELSYPRPLAGVWADDRILFRFGRNRFCPVVGKQALLVPHSSLGIEKPLFESVVAAIDDFRPKKKLAI